MLPPSRIFTRECVKERNVFHFKFSKFYCILIMICAISLSLPRSRSVSISSDMFLLHELRNICMRDYCARISFEEMKKLKMFFLLFFFNLKEARRQRKITQTTVAGQKSVHKRIVVFFLPIPSPFVRALTQNSNQLMRKKKERNMNILRKRL